VSVGPIKQSSLSLPRRVANALRDAMRSGQISAGEQFPMETQLADQLGVSRATLRDGLRILEAEGLVVRRGGVGTFATALAMPIRPGIERLYGVTDLIRRDGYTPSSRDARIRTEVAAPDVAQALAIEPETPVIHVSRTYLADDHPVIQCEDYFPKRLLPQADELQSFRGEVSLYDLLRERCGIEIVQAVATILPVLADATLVQQLGVPPGLPLLLLEQVHFVADGRPVLFSRNTHDSRAIQFQVVRMREW
jgi:GntR family transcriptional regulator